MTLITSNFESHAAKLVSDMPVQQKQQLVTEMRDSIEIVHTSEYGNFLKYLFPAFHRLLSEGQPQFAEGPEQKIRNMLLEVLNRLPNNETLRPHVERMLSLCMKLLETDNEENAVICLRVIFDLHKNFRPTLESEVQPFLDFVQRIYQNLPRTVQLVFEGRSSSQAASTQASQSSNQQARAQAAAQAQANAQAAQQQAHAAQQQAQQAQARAAQLATQAQQAQQVVAQAQQQHAKAPTAQTQDSMRQAAQAAAQVQAQHAQISAQVPGLVQAANAARAQAQVAAQLAQQAAAQLAEAAPQSASRTSSEAADGQGAADGTSAATTRVSPGVLTRSTESFKVLTECPLIVMLLFQLYPRYIQTTIPNLIPLMVHTLALRSSTARTNPRNKLAATDFMTAQVKTLSFLTYLLRAFADFMRPYQESIPKCVIQLLLTCPPESISTRKDILVATRHILATDFRVGFFSQIDVLLDENVLVGAGGTASRASYETLRPLACSTLADLIHYVRGELNIKQLSRVVYIFSCNIHDSSLPLSIQTTSVRLLLNLVESIFHKNDPEARDLLVRILHCLVYKFRTLKEAIPKMLANAKSRNAEPSTSGAEKSVADTVKEIKQLLKTMTLGVKTVVWSVSNSRMSSDVASAATLQKGMSESECLLVAGLIKCGLHCFVIHHTGPDAIAQEEKEVLDYFAGIFTVLDSRNFTNVFQLQIPFLYERMLANSAVSTILQHFLANSNVSRYFADILLTFLVGRMNELGATEEPQAAVLLRLFKLVFGSITLFPENEPVLRPHLATIVTSAMKFASCQPYPMNYFALLRALFKSIGGGKFEQLYKEFLPLLPTLLHGLIRCYACAQHQALKELLLELCLTLPARLSALLPYLNLLMQPVLHALRSSAEQITLALRSLEFWIDHLHPDFLQPLMAPVLREMITALCKQLRPHPYSFGTSALRILGKLGGRNRHYLQHREPFEVRTCTAPSLAMELRPPADQTSDLSELETGPKKPLSLELDAAVARAVSILRDAASTPDKKTLAADSFQLVRVCLARIISPPSLLATAGSSHAAGVNAMAVAAVEANIAASATNPPRASSAAPTAAPSASTKTEVAAPASSSGRRLAWPVLDTPVAAAVGSGAVKSSKSSCQQQQEEALLVELISGCFFAAAIPALKDEALPFVSGLMRHAALLLLYSLQSSQQALVARSAQAHHMQSRPRVFIDALITSFRGGCPPSVTEVGSSALATLLDTLNAFPECAASADAIYDMIADELCRIAYARDRRAKTCGALQLRAICERRDAVWLLSRENLIVSALLKLSGDGAIEAHPSSSKEASELLISLLRTCHAKAMPEVHAELQARAFGQLVARFTSGLSNCNAGVRDASQRALEELSALIGKPLGDVLMPFRESHLAPLFSSQLRGLPLVTRVAHLEAITFCLKASLADGTPLMPISEPLLKLLQEALLIAEADEPPRESRAKLMGMHVRGVPLDVHVRVVCIETLCAVMSCEGFKQPHPSELRNRMIGCFFKSLTVRSEEVVAVSRDALAAVISQHKLQKELLQASLRPVLLNLADYRKLSVPLLQGLGRLLSLLANFFNLTLGEKLLEHLRRWTDAEALSKSKAKSGDETAIPAAILALFHLLPPAPDTFLDHLVTITLDLEANMPGSTSAGRYWSPFREALVPYLARHATESVTYFLKRLGDPRLFRMLLSVIKCAEGAPVRNQLATQSPALMATTFDAVVPSAPLLRFQGVLLVQALVKRLPAWLPSVPDVLSKLMEVWRSPERRARLAPEAQAKMPLEQIKESKLLIKCFVSYCRAQATVEPAPNEDLSLARHIELLFMMLSTFSEHTLVNYDFLKDFYLEEVATKSSIQTRCACIRYFMRFFENATTPQEDKVQALQLLILPMLSTSFKRREARQVLSQEIISSIISRLLGGEMLPVYEESLRIELLKLATLLIEHVPQQLVEHRKELIKFSWNHLKSEDTQSKQCAYVNVCRFIQVYDTPPKIILQVYVALLRTFQPDARALVKQALDILTPALPQRLPAGDHRYPTWIKWTKKIIVEEGHSLPQLIHIWQLVVRHPDLFFSSAAQFVPQMVNSLNRIGLSPNCSNENRKLAVDLAQLIISWELKRHELKKQRSSGAALDSKADADEAGRKRAAEAEADGSASKKLVKVEEGDSAKAAPAAAEAPASAPRAGAPSASAPVAAHPPPDDDFKPNAAIVEVLINFLIRVALIAAESKEAAAAGLSERCVVLLSSGLSVWPDANIKYNFFEKQLMPQPDSKGGTPQDPSNGLLSGLLILRAILAKQPKFLLRNLKALQNLLRPAFQQHTEYQKMVTALCAFLGEALSALASLASTGGTPVQLEVAQFVHWLSEIIAAGLTSTKETQVFGSLQLLGILGKSSTDMLDQQLPTLAKVLQRLAKELFSRRDAASSAASTTAATPAGTGAASASSNQEADQVLLKAVRLAIHIGSPRLGDSGDIRKLFLATMFGLIEKVDDVELLMEIVRVLGPWITGPPTQPPALSFKERAGFVLKMATHFEQLSAPELHVAFLQVVLKLFCEPQAGRAELLAKIEPAFMLGLRSRDPGLRNQFFQLLNERIGLAVPQRLSFIISQQEWDSLSGTLWLRQATQLLLAAVDTENALTPPPAAVQLPVLRFVPLSDTASAKVSSEVSEVLHAHHTFLSECSESYNLGSLMTPLVELLHDSSSSALAFDLWVSVFPQMWNRLSPAEQQERVKPLITLLSKAYNLKQHSHNPNVIQGWLQALSACRPVPKLPAGLLKHLAKHYNAWHLAIPLMLHFAEAYPEEPQWYDALGELYALLGDRDGNFALWSRRAVHDETKNALALEQFGAWHSAQAAYAECMNRWQAGEMALVNTPQPELTLWEEGIVRSAKALNQWELLSEYAKAWPLAQPELLMECAWKSADWERLRELFFSKHSALPQPSIKMLQTYAAIHDGKLLEAEARCSEGIQFALVQWNSLPTIDVASHTPLLQMFQQFQELQESAQMLMELNNAMQKGQLPELSSILLTWRERLPNVWEELPAWNDLVSWRNHMFSHINNVLARMTDANNPTLSSLGFQEMLWTIVRFAHVARRQMLPEACVSIIAKIQTVNAGNGPSADLNNSFAKLREQARSCLQMPHSLKHGLNALHSADIGFLPAKKKAEVFQLKGELLLASAAGADEEAVDEAQSAEGAKHLATAIQVHAEMPKAWMLWGEFCDRMHRNDYGANPQWAERALSCYLLSAQLRHNRSVSMLPRTLSLLDEAVGEQTAPALAKTFGRLCEGTPTWLWLPWLPQLLQALRRYYGPQVQYLLLRIAKEYPQALYFPLRNFIADPSVGQGDPPASWAPEKHPGAPATAGSTAVSDGAASSSASGGATARPLAAPASAMGGYAALVVSALVNEHPQLLSQLDLIFDHLKAVLQPRPAERLLAVICELSSICLSVPPSPPERLPPEIVAALQSLDQAFGFSAGRATDSDLAALHAACGERFVKEFVSEPPELLSELLSRLEALRATLEAALELPTNRQSLPSLAQGCEHLVFAQQPLVEIPGQYSGDQEPALDTHVLIERLSADVMIRRDAFTGVTVRSFCMLSDDGGARSFHLRVDSPLTPTASLGLERTMQLLRLINRRLLKSREARRRALYLHLSPMIRLGHGVTMHETDSSAISLASVLVNARSEAGEAPNGIVLTHQRTLSRGMVSADDDARRERLRQAFDDACRAVPEDLLSTSLDGYLYKAVQRWDMKRHFSSQLGLHAFLCYSIGLRAQQPHSFVVSRATCNVCYSDFDPAPLPSTEGNPRTAYGVPFRLTRNLERLITPFGVDGTFAAVFGAAADCLANAQKCPIAMWLDYLAGPEIEGTDFRPPWSASGEEAESRARSVSPAEAVQKAGKSADVHATLRSLISEATDEEALQAMPPAWQAWL